MPGYRRWTVRKEFVCAIRSVNERIGRIEACIKISLNIWRMGGLPRNLRRLFSVLTLVNFLLPALEWRGDLTVQTPRRPANTRSPPLFCTAARHTARILPRRCTAPPKFLHEVNT